MLSLSEVSELRFFKMYCPDEVFERLSDASDGYTCDKPCLEFAYDCLGEDINFTSKCLIVFPEFNNDVLDDWETFENWLNDISFRLSVDDIWEPTFNYYEDNAPAPIAIFKNHKALKKLILAKLCDPIYNEIKVEMEAGYVELTNSGNSLYLIFTEYAAWGLGHADQILVVKDLGYLCEENDFYKLDITE